MATFTGSPSGTDDGQSNSGNGAFSNTGTSLSVGRGANISEQIDSFIRIQNVTIPQGATITAATFEWTGIGGASVVDHEFYLNDEDDAVAPTSQASHAAKVRTTAFVSMSNVSTDNTLYTTPDMSAVIQEVVDRAGWASGNDMMLLVDNVDLSNNQVVNFASDEHATRAVSVLRITYQVVEEGTAAVDGITVTVSATGLRINVGTGAVAGAVAISATGRAYHSGQGAVSVGVAAVATGRAYVTGEGALAVAVQIAGTGRRYHSGQAAIEIALGMVASGRRFTPPTPFTYRSTLRFGPRYGRRRGN